MIKIGHGCLVHDTLKSVEWVINEADVLHADCDVIIFG